MKARKNAMQNYDIEVENEDNYEDCYDVDHDDYQSGDNDDDNEDNEHLFLHCNSHDIMRQDLFSRLGNILDFNISDMNSKSLRNLPLFGKPDLDASKNKMIIDETNCFMENMELM